MGRYVRGGTGHSGQAGWDDHGRNRLRLTFGHGAVDGLGVVRALSGDRDHRTLDLLEQGAHHREITDLVGRQLGGQNSTAIRIGRPVKLAPRSAVALAVFRNSL